MSYDQEDPSILSDRPNEHDHGEDDHYAYDDESESGAGPHHRAFDEPSSFIVRGNNNGQH